MHCLNDSFNSLDVICARMQSYAGSPALFWQGQHISYVTLFRMIFEWEKYFQKAGIKAGTVCAIVGDYSPKVCALIFALMRSGSILVPFTPAVQTEVHGLMGIAGVEVLLRFDTDDSWSAEWYNFPSNALITEFQARRRAGLVVFTSGSTGKPKGILHDCARVLKKFVDCRKGWRTVLFLMLDHFGGFNTLMSTFAYGGTAVCLHSRNPSAVCEVIKDSQATLLPTTPTFINLLLASHIYRLYDLSSIHMISYGTEVMASSTLIRLREAFPNAIVKQTYGLSELGVLRSQSENDDSLWVKIGGNGFEIKVIDSILWVRSEANMVGYLNADSPFDNDGWMCTGDSVEVNGEYVRILGRNSEMINVGGQKVFPAEVESVLMSASNVKDARVFGVKHPLMGNIVHAEVTLVTPEDHLELTDRLRGFCLDRMTKFKIPVRVTAVDEDSILSTRFKKIRIRCPER